MGAKAPIASLVKDTPVYDVLIVMSVH